MGHGRVIIREVAAVRWKDWREHERGGMCVVVERVCYCVFIGRMRWWRRRRRVERAMLLESGIARRATWEEPAMYVPDRL